MEKEVNKWKLDLTEHVEFSGTTWNGAKEEDENERLAHDLDHAILGIQSEVGELADAYKKVVGYGRELDIPNLKEEIGDMMFYISRLMGIMQVGTVVFPFEVSEYKLLLDKFSYRSDIVRRISTFVNSISVDGAILGPTNTINLIKLVIQCLFVMGEEHGFTLEECIDLNIKKLRHRYNEGKFTQQAVENRDLDGERKILEGRSGEENS